MADSMRDIKRRIKSVASTKQITHAMELVAGAKMRQARNLADARRAYTDYLIDTMHLIAAALKNEGTNNEFLKPGKGTKDLYIVVTSDKGLAGGFNSNLLKYAVTEIGKSSEPAIVAVGMKGLEYFRRRNYEIVGSYCGDSDEASVELASEIGKAVSTAFLKGDYQDVYIVYNRFESMIRQEPSIVHLLPLTEEELAKGDDRIGRKSEEAHEERESHFKDVDLNYMLFEPGASYMAKRLIPYYVDNAVYGALLESAAGELASRRMAMENATDNANEILDDLNLRYNRARQGAITQEITEIISGAEAAK